MKKNLEALPAIRPDPRNARKHGQKNQEMIRKSLEEVGPFRSIALDGQNIVRAGNGVYEQARKLGLKIRTVDAAPDELIAVRRKDLKGTKAKRAALYDNKAGELAEWDAEVLEAIAKEQQELLDGILSAQDLKGLGIDGYFEFSPVGAETQSVLDSKSPIKCPKCGNEFVPKG